MLKVTFVHNRKGKLNAKGEALVQMRLYLSRKEKYYSTGIYIKPSEFDYKRQRVKSHPLTPKYNKILADLEQSALNAFFDLKDTATLDRVISKLKGTDQGNNFIDFVSFQIENNKTVEPSTMASHKLLVKYLSKYRKSTTFSDINYSFIVNFQSFLQKQLSERSKKLHPNYIALLLRLFRGYVTEAIKQGHMNTDPFLSFKIKTVATEKTYLEPHELKAFENVMLLDIHENERYAKDIFLFCCYTGLRISDAEGLKVKHIIETKEGLRLIKRPQKTRKSQRQINLPLYLLFEGKPEKIIITYLEGKAPEDTIFPRMNRKSYNGWIDKLRTRAKITKYFTSHTARHTFGMMMIQKYPIAVVSKMMGHASVSTTEVYARMKTATIDEMLKNG